MRQTVAEVNLSALEHNVNILRAHAGSREFLSMVKADAYGHGVIPVVRKLVEMGLQYFGVATLEEALEIRREFPDVEIMICGDIGPEDFKEAEEENIIITLHSLTDMKRYVDDKRRTRTHLKIDSGMHRIGLQLKDLPEAYELVRSIKPEGIFTHVAKADELDRTSAEKQVSIFKEAVELFSREGIHFKYVHFSNSAGLVNLDLSFTNFARAGISLYGYKPSKDVGAENLRPILSLYSEISDIRELEAGEGVSYSHIFVTDQPSTIATMPIGYADGYKRNLSNRSRVYIGGEYYPQVGRITMDQTMVDVTGSSVKLRDPVELMGEHVTADELAEMLDTISYEILTSIGKRVPRRYVED